MHALPPSPTRVIRERYSAKACTSYLLLLSSELEGATSRVALNHLAVADRVWGCLVFYYCRLGLAVAVCRAMGRCGTGMAVAWIGVSMQGEVSVWGVVCMWGGVFVWGGVVTTPCRRRIRGLFCSRVFCSRRGRGGGGGWLPSIFRVHLFRVHLAIGWCSGVALATRQALVCDRGDRGV